MPSASADVVVWRIVLDPARAPDAAALAELSEAERARADRFATEALRNRWLWGHVGLRRILARELECEPAAIAYGRGGEGKPFLAAPAKTGLEFNFSDSADRALVAVSRRGPVGVDVEWQHRHDDLAAVAERCFAGDEVRALAAVAAPERLAAFYRIWTRKEAYLKALGAGLGYGLGRFAVTHDARDVRLLHVDGAAEAGPRWQLRAIDVGEGYEAALAAAWEMREVAVSDHRFAHPGTGRADGPRLAPRD